MVLVSCAKCVYHWVSSTVKHNLKSTKHGELWRHSTGTITPNLWNASARTLVTITSHLICFGPEWYTTQVEDLHKNRNCEIDVLKNSFFSLAVDAWNYRWDICFHSCFKSLPLSLLCEYLVIWEISSIVLTSKTIVSDLRKAHWITLQNFVLLEEFFFDYLYCCIIETDMTIIANQLPNHIN